MTTTAQALVDETKRHLLSGLREPLNKLAAPMTDSATSMTFTYPVTSQFKVGAYLEIDLEIVYVWAIPTDTTATVQRGMLGSTPTTHDAADLVRVNPKFPDFTIFKALNDEITDLSSPSNGLYAVRAVDITATGNAVGYDLTGTTGLIDILEVRYHSPGSDKDWPILPSWNLARQVDGTDFPSGLTLNTYEQVPVGRPIRVLYKGAFTQLSGLTDVVETVTVMSSTMVDILPIGAALRLMAPRALKQTFSETQGEPRRASETPAGSSSTAMTELRRERRDRIQSEANRLVAAYPTRFPVTSAGSW